MTTVDRDQLLTSAKDFADRALKAYTEEDTKTVLFNAAISLEHLSKAYLCSMNPALLMELRNGQFDSLLHLTGHGEKAKKLKSPRTISARDAMTRVEHVLPSLSVPKERLTQLIDVRDGVVHVGYLEENETREILTAYLRLSNELFEALAVSGNDQWGRHKDLVDSLISQSLSEVEREVKHRMAAAQLRFADLMSNIPENAQVSVMAARQAQAISFIGDDEKAADIECPVCGDDGASCIGPVDYDVDVDVEPDGQGGYYSTVMGGTEIIEAERFVCGCCELRLDNGDELRAAGIKTTIQDGDPVDDDEGWWEHD